VGAGKVGKSLLVANRIEKEIGETRIDCRDRYSLGEFMRWAEASNVLLFIACQN
jgi:hypothetical protein